VQDHSAAEPELKPQPKPSEHQKRSLRISAAKRAAAQAARDAADEAEREEELRRAREKFKEVDVDGNGTLDRDEVRHLAEWVLRSFLKSGQQNVVITQGQLEQEVDKLLAQADTDGDGLVDLEEFTAWFIPTSQRIQAFSRKQELLKKQKRAQKRNSASGSVGKAAARVAGKTQDYTQRSVQMQGQPEPEPELEPEPERLSE
jgi:hypothetical protein